MQQDTYLSFKDGVVTHSPDIKQVFDFLANIEKETDSLLGFNKQLDLIKESYLEMLDFVLFLSNKLKQENIDFAYTLKNNPMQISQHFHFYLPLRSQAIVLFASLEVLLTLYTAYQFKTTDKNHLISLTMEPKNTKKFINLYLLNNENDYYNRNIARFKKIDAKKIRNLRNSLTHFFSIGPGGLSLSPELLATKARKLENQLAKNRMGHVLFISESDISFLIKSAYVLQIKRWAEDCYKNPVEFKLRMANIIELVRKEGAVIVQNVDKTHL